MIHNKYYEIMGSFLSDYSKKIYGRELIKKVSISQKNIALTLEELEKKAILSSEVIGNMKYFFLNKQNPLCERYLILTEIENSIQFLEKHSKLNQIFEKIKKINKSQIICIFGSYAKEIEKKDSDLDLFVVGDIKEKEIKEIGRDYNIEINIKKSSKHDFISMLKDKSPLINEIIENHILISGYEAFVMEVVNQKW